MTGFVRSTIATSLPAGKERRLQAEEQRLAAETRQQSIVKMVSEFYSRHPGLESRTQQGDIGSES
jgi:hypothetical protein